MPRRALRPLQRSSRALRPSWTVRALALGVVVSVAPHAAHAQRAHALTRGAAGGAHAGLERSMARPFATLGTDALVLRDSIVALARKQLGKRYRFGGTTPLGGFDCSGLVKYVAAAFDIALPRTAAEQARVGARVSADTSKLQPGDLLAFGRGQISHVGIYIGNGRMIHASSGAGRVIESRVDRNVPALPLRVVRRVVVAPEVEQRWLQ